MRRRDKHHDNPKRFGMAAEDKLALRGDYKRTPNSGASGAKGDFRLGNFMVEHKATKHASYSITGDTLGKLRYDAMTDTVDSVLVVTLGTGQQFAVLPLSTFERLVEDGSEV